MNSIFVRRSIRRFTEKPVEEAKIENLLRAAMQAPSGKDLRPWDFIVVTDAADKLAMSGMSEFAGPCARAPVAIVVLANHQRAPDDGMWWVQGLAACTENMLLQAVEEGLGAVWLGMYPVEERVEKMRAYFCLPETVTPFAIVAVGYSDRENRFKDHFDPERIHYGKW